MAKSKLPLQTPDYIPHCSQCPNAKSGFSKLVRPHGLPGSEVMLLGLSPGPDDKRKGIPFSGRIAKDLAYQYLPLANLQQEQVVLNFAVKCAKADYASPSENCVHSCADKHLRKELYQYNPDIVIATGADVAGLFPRDDGQQLDMERHHGIPYASYYGNWNGTVIPIYSPTAAMVSSDVALKVREGFKMLGKYRKYEAIRPEDEYPKPDYRLVSTAGQVRKYLMDMRNINHDVYDNAIAMDTEFIPVFPGIPHCYSISTMPGSGLVILERDSKQLSAEVQQYMYERNCNVILHNAVADVDMLEQMHLPLSWDRITDTMQMLYHRFLPTSLKTAAYRLCGMEMTDFMDLAIIHAKPHALAYLRLAEQQDVTNIHGPKSRIQTADKKASKIIKAITQDPSTDPWKRWAAIPPEERAEMESLIGPMPTPNVAHFPAPVLTSYAGRDPDATLRIYLRLKHDSSLRLHIPKHTRLEIAEG